MKRPRGRAAKPAMMMGIHLRLSTAEVAAVDDLRRKELDVPTRPEMIRRVLEEKLVEEEEK